MATLKLKNPPAPAVKTTGPRAPVRGAGAGVKRRPTLAEAQALRDEREARYQEQLRLRYGDRPPPAHLQRGGPPPQRQNDPRGRAPQRPMPQGPGSARPKPPGPGAAVNTAFGARSTPAHGQPERQPPRPHPQEPAARRAPPTRGRPAPRFNDDEDDRDDPPAHAPGSMRLSKRMSELGIASRREADEWIAQGWVRVDDQVVRELGSRVLPGQRVTVDAKARFQQAQRVTVLINKPIGYVSGQAEDGYEPASVLVVPQHQWREDNSGTRFLREHLRGLAPAGRLDIDSVGLLVLTQDGRVAKQLIGEDSDVEKEYLVRVDKPVGGLPDSELARLRHGLELDGEALRPAQVEWINEDQLRFVLKEGKKRQIRRMCEAVGLKVVGLKRVRIGKVMLGDLPAGQWRYLRRDESFV